MEPNISSQPTAPEIQTPIIEPVTTAPSNPSSKTKYILLGVLILLIIAAVGGGTYYLGVVKQQPTMQKNNNNVVTVTSTLAPTSATTPTPSSIIDPTTNWKTYTNTFGKYQISYPNNYIVNVGKSVGVDGIIIQQLNSYAELVSKVIPNTNGNIKISINSTETNYKTPQEVANTSGCVDPSNKEGAPYTIDGNAGLIFENTPCGPFGITVIDTVKNGRAYGIGIEGTVDYKYLKPEYEKVLSTFKFTQ